MCVVYGALATCVSGLCSSPHELGGSAGTSLCCVAGWTSAFPKGYVLSVLRCNGLEEMPVKEDVRVPLLTCGMGGTELSQERKAMMCVVFGSKGGTGWCLTWGASVSSVRAKWVGAWEVHFIAKLLHPKILPFLHPGF